MTEQEFRDLIQKAEQVQQLREQMAHTLEPLYGDANFALAEWLKDKGNQFWRRTLIRCILVVIEAVIWNMKNMIPRLAGISGVPLSVFELEVVNERSVKPDGQTKTKYIRFPENLKNTFKIFAKVHGATYSMNDAHDFDALCDTNELRNRLMHPKIPTDPPVTDDDIRKSQRGLAWLSNEHNRLVEICRQSVASKMNSET